MGGPDQPDYLNAVVAVRSTLTPHALLAACLGVERRHGREREVRWAARTLDVDVVTYGDLVLDGPDLVLPHPRAPTTGPSCSCRGPRSTPCAELPVRRRGPPARGPGGRPAGRAAGGRHPRRPPPARRRPDQASARVRRPAREARPRLVRRARRRRHGAVGLAPARPADPAGRRAAAAALAGRAGPAVVAVVVLVLARGTCAAPCAGRAAGRRVDPLVAARVAVLAKAAVYGGGMLTGWYAAQAVAAHPARRAGGATALSWPP